MDTPQFPSFICFPRPPTLLLPFYSPPPHTLLSTPPLRSFNPIAESTGGSSRYMYSRLLCGRHDNRHEFDMALTYPGGCEAVWMQRFKWHSRISRMRL
ncbi:hypothetical protein PBY51_005500 [Eleginops maclovinus]|uniref:Uncharacterized protein n=1 Tax=Eleginops maclovinus TaxID=56733 RepID=A0AAN8AHH7_ELEMC|nr:hypothetical protein PBY51_005500 [Eleginops maclovinus]